MSIEDDHTRTIFRDVTIRFPGKVFPINELGVSVTIGGRESLRGAGPISRYDLLRSAERNKIDARSLLRTFAKQLAIYNLKEEIPDLITPGPKDYLRASKSLLAGFGEIPYSVGITTNAILRYGLSDTIDPRVFAKGLITNDLRGELGYLEQFRIEVDDKYIESIRKSPAVLTGSALVILESPFGNQSILMRRRIGKGTYENAWTLPGGHSDRVEEPAGLEELEEETSLLSRHLKGALPLGVADNVILQKYGSSKTDYSFDHYLNYVWQLNLNEADLGNDLPRYLRSGDAGEDWFPVPDYLAVSMAERGEVTPIAKCGMQLAGFLDK